MLFVSIFPVLLSRDFVLVPTHEDNATDTPHFMPVATNRPRCIHVGDSRVYHFEGATSGETVDVV